MIDNPYQPPCDSSTGSYDWSLAKRVTLGFALLAIWYLLLAGVVSWREFSASRSLRSTQENMEAFFVDWKADPRLRK